MLTPFTLDGQIDFDGVLSLIKWYESAGVGGLFAVTQSSEMFFLTLEERISLAEFVVKHATVPVIASGHISDDLYAQVEEINKISKTGIQAFVLVTNRFACEDESDDVWNRNFQFVLDNIDQDIELGLYECPYPYKRLLSDEQITMIASNPRFKFLKDTCCNIEVLKRRLSIMNGSGFRLFNANATTLRESLKYGAAGYSSVMANFHPELYVSLMQSYDLPKSEMLQAFLTVCSQIERQCYPVNAKYNAVLLGLPITTYTRSKDSKELTETFKEEIKQMHQLVTAFKDRWEHK